MKDEPEKTNSKPAEQQEIKSSDIPNAHAAGDGSMGRNDEKVEEENNSKGKSTTQPNENTSY